MKSWKPCLALLALVAVVSPARADTPDHGEFQGPMSVYTAKITGGQVVNVPPRLGPSAGHGVAFLTFDETTKVLCYSVSDTHVANETVAHFHGPAAPGAHSPHHYWPPKGMSLPLGSPKDGCTDPLGKDAEKALKDGLWFLAIRSTDYVLGELRGQVLPTGVRYNKNAGGGGGDHDH
jgi:hypothetical protein